MMQLKIKQLRGFPPFQKNTSDAGYDLFFNPVEGTPNLYIESGQSVLVPTGISTSFPENYVLEIKNRSGIASKMSLIVGAHIVDSGYRGEIFVNLHNVGSKSQVLEPFTRIAQFLVYEIQKPTIEFVEDLEDSDRGNGGFGSTGV